MYAIRSYYGAISYNWEFFAREAKKILVDIDESELNKPTLNIDIKIHSDAKYFIEQLDDNIDNLSLDFTSWLNRCEKYKKDFPTIRNNFV